MNDRDRARREIRRRTEAAQRANHVNCRCVPTITKNPEPLPKISAEDVASARRVVLPSAEIIYRASVGSSTARAVIGLLTHRAKFTRN